MGIDSLGLCSYGETDTIYIYTYIFSTAGLNLLINGKNQKICSCHSVAARVGDEEVFNDQRIFIFNC